MTESRVISIAVDPKGRWLFSTHDDNLLRRWVLSPGLIRKPYCDQAVELLPDGEWVVWADPDDETKDPRWVNYSPGAKRWLGYHAPSADGTRWEHQPLDADCTDPAAAGRSG